MDPRKEGMASTDTLLVGVPRVMLPSWMAVAVPEWRHEGNCVVVFNCSTQNTT